MLRCHRDHVQFACVAVVSGHLQARAVGVNSWGERGRGSDSGTGRRRRRSSSITTKMGSMRRRRRRRSITTKMGRIRRRRKQSTANCQLFVNIAA